MKKGFTVLEMILVLTVITIIVLLTIPNIAQKKKVINNIGCQALIEVVNAQILVYELDGKTAENVQQLVEAGLITEAQTVCPNGKKVVIIDGQATVQ
ncbi:MAG: competence type IV pilus major pilin ComGC [Erysipelotrichia bacterium]|nr:competence type IV pilus major pilin ComGC [Erysipelotrichia bacterium]